MKCEFNFSDGKYPVYIGEGLLDNIHDYLVFEDTARFAVITDDSVEGLYLSKLIDYCGPNAYIVAHGEDSKTLRCAESILNWLADINFKRNDVLIALGGGVVGDLCGLVASLYMRGIRYVQIPTTLLAGIDSALGGKTAVNLQKGKNLAGHVYQPAAVIFDTNTVKTLPEKFLLDGIGEGIKYAVLEGGELFEILENGLNINDVGRFCELCVLAKKRIAESDEKEHGQRRLLNLGHTLGHVVERRSHFSLTHGICVAIGLRLMCKACYKRELLSQEDYYRIIALLDKYGFPESPFPIYELTDEISLDKKAEGELIHLVTVNGIGDCRVTDKKLNAVESFFNGL